MSRRYRGSGAGPFRRGAVSRILSPHVRTLSRHGARPPRRRRRAAIRSRACSPPTGHPQRGWRCSGSKPCCWRSWPSASRHWCIATRGVRRRADTQTPTAHVRPRRDSRRCAPPTSFRATSSPSTSARCSCSRCSSAAWLSRRHRSQVANAFSSTSTRCSSARLRCSDSSRSGPPATSWASGAAQARSEPGLTRARGGGRCSGCWASPGRSWWPCSASRWRSSRSSAC